MCFIELVDFNENMLKAKVEKKTRTRRAGGTKKKAEAVAAEPVVAEAAPIAEPVVAEVAPAVEPVVEAPAETPAEEKAE